MEDQRRRLVTRTLLAGALMAALSALSYVFFDRPAAWTAHELKDTQLHNYAVSLSYLADHTVVNWFFTIGFAASAINLTGPAPKTWARNLLYICLSVALAMALVDSIKFMFGRCRPELLFSEGRFGFTWFTRADVFNSFPSGHTTRIFAMVTAIAILFYRLAAPVFVIAALVGISRVLALRHYPSDVLMGAYLGVIVAWWTYWVIMKRIGQDR